MSDEAEDRDGTGEEPVTAESGEPQAGTWAQPAPGPRWSEIASDPGLGVPGNAEATPIASDDPAEPAPATEAGRSRRPSSLRSDSPSSTDVPRRRLTPPSFPRSGTPAAPQSDPESSRPVSESPRTGRSGQVSNVAGTLLDRLPAGKLQTFVKERPEAGLGLAFIGGLLIATILRRLAR